MEKQAIKDRLLALNFDTAVVDAFVDGLDDENCKRMKDADEAVAAFKDAVAKSAQIDPDATPKEPAPATDDGGVLDMEKVLDLIEQRVKESMPKSVELELPAIETALKEIRAEVDKITESLKEFGKADEERLKEMSENASEATRSRLNFRFASTPPPEKRKETPDVPIDGVVIKDADGKVFPTMTEMLTDQGGA